MLLGSWLKMCVWLKLILFLFLFSLSLFRFCQNVFKNANSKTHEKNNQDGESIARSKSAVKTNQKTSLLTSQSATSLSHSSSPTSLTGDVGVFTNVPSSPTDVSTAIVSSRFITITWARPVNADETNINGYSVYYKRQDSNRYWLVLSSGQS